LYGFLWVAFIFFRNASSDVRCFKAGPRSRLVDYIDSERGVSNADEKSPTVSSPTHAKPAAIPDKFAIVEMKDDSDEFFEVEEKFKACINGLPRNASVLTF